MEPKKNPQADLRPLRGLFIQIGLVVSLAVVIAAFSVNWQPSQAVYLDPATLPIEQEIVPQTTRQDFVRAPILIKPSAGTSTADIIKIVSNDAVESATMETSEVRREEAKAEPLPVDEQAYEEELFVIVNEPPKFQGADPAASFRQWVDERLIYPSASVQGRVVVAFIIEKDGSLTNFELMGDYDKTLADETMRVVRQSPRWTPARNKGEAIRLRYILPVEYRLQ